MIIIGAETPQQKAVCHAESSEASAVAFHPLFDLFRNFQAYAGCPIHATPYVAWVGKHDPHPSP
jgi:hypothetical protein